MECKASPDPWDKLKLDGAAMVERDFLLQPHDIISVSVRQSHSRSSHQSRLRPETSKAPSSTGFWFPSLGFLIFESSLPFVSISVSISAFCSVFQSFFFSRCFSVNCLKFLLHFTHISLNNKTRPPGQYSLHY